jgi:N-acetylgalactosamine-N,N'-diacetylbacillosaminyl-diphospho-undecaprenol 4-alpha-N-acetylgalactosaminyltransferase
VVALDGRGPLAEVVDPDLLVDLRRLRARSAGPALVRALRRLGPDLTVVASQTHLNLLLRAVRPALRRGTRLVLREPALRTGADRAQPRPADRLLRLLPAPDLVIASSEAMRVELAAAQGPGVRVAVLPNPVDVAALRRAAAGAVRPAGPGRRLVTVGRLVPGKAVDELLRAVATDTEPDDRLTVVGDGPEGPALRALAQRLGLASRVEFTGHLADPAPVVASADALVTASRAEGLPNAVLEALAVGTPVVATTDLEGLAELAATAPPGAVTLVPRAELAGTLRRLPAAERPGPAASLLPVEFERDRVVDRLLALLP